MSRINRIALALISMFSLPAFAEDVPVTNLRDSRYCEVLLGFGGLFVPKQLEVYNTIGLNDCPEDKWSKLREAQIKSETKATFVKLNGPRFWVLDNFVGSNLINPNVRSFGGIEMREAGVLQVSLGDVIGSRVPYQEHHVHRKTISRFKAGLPVFQLIDSKGSIYFMQSYSLEKVALSYDILAGLGSKLKLPSGWRFRSVVLKDDYFLKAENDQATVLQDELLNTYQKSSENAGAGE